MAIDQWIYRQKMVIFHRYFCLPGGKAHMNSRTQKNRVPIQLGFFNLGFFRTLRSGGGPDLGVRQCFTGQDQITTLPKLVSLTISPWNPSPMPPKKSSSSCSECNLEFGHQQCLVPERDHLIIARDDLSDHRFKSILFETKNGYLETMDNPTITTYIQLSLFFRVGYRWIYD